MNKVYPRIPSGCAISGIMHTKGECFSGVDIMKSIALMRDRSNGLGGGFAAYGIYPEYPDHFALHVFYDNESNRIAAEEYFNEYLNVDASEIIKTRKVKTITNPPLIWRYFVQPKKNRLVSSEISEEEYMIRVIMTINSSFEGAYIFSSGKNMGAFKGVGYPEEIGEFYRLEEYQGYIWTAHGRFPTNTPGWWGGAHPFTLLDWSIVHNGEISSYGANARFLEMFGYKCTLQTDTEAITYIFDYLLRKQGLSLEMAVAAVAAPTWQEVERMDDESKKLIKALRAVYGSVLINGPFSIILGTKNGIMALNDRLKLRNMVAATKGDFLYVSSEESGIRAVCSQPERIWVPKGGEPVIGVLEGVSGI